MSSPPLITNIFTADPSAHVFDGRLYIYSSHDRPSTVAASDDGDQYDMVDYHVFSTDTLTLTPPHGLVDHGRILALADIPWAGRQLWAPDAARRDGKFYLYFPARDRAGLFRIGVAVADSPVGPFRADPEPIPGSFSIDPAVFIDDDDDDDDDDGGGGGGGGVGVGGGEAYMYFGGLRGGQLQYFQDGANASDPSLARVASEPTGPGIKALCPKVALMSRDMRTFAGPPRDLLILAPESGAPIGADDHDRRFFEAAWMHRRGRTYYFSYSTGDTHYIVYATGASPLGPFTYAGRILEPVRGWTTHHSIVHFHGRCWLFHHDAELSGGVSHLRCVKVREMLYDEAGRMLPAKHDDHGVVNDDA